MPTKRRCRASGRARIVVEHGLFSVPREPLLRLLDWNLSAFFCCELARCDSASLVTQSLGFLPGTEDKVLLNDYCLARSFVQEVFCFAFTIPHFHPQPCAKKTSFVGAQSAGRPSLQGPSPTTF